MTLPVGGHRTGGAGHRLIGRMTIRWRQRRSFEKLAGPVVVEPILPRFKAL